MKKSLRILFAGLAAIFLVGVFIVYSDYSGLKTERLNKAISEARLELKTSAAQLNSELIRVRELADGLEKTMSDKMPDSKRLYEALRLGLEQNRDIFGFGVGFEPYEWDSNRRLFAPFYIRPNGDPKLTFVDTAYDYTREKWYYQPRDSGAAWFEPPYYGIVAKTLIAEYSAPFHKIDDSGNSYTAGIVYIDLSLAGLTELVSRLGIGRSGYAFLTSQNGNIIVHPRAEWVKEGKNIKDLASEYGDKRINSFFLNGNHQNQGYLEVTNPLNGLESRLMLETIPETGWKLGMMIVTSEFEAGYQEYFRKLIILIIVSISFLFSLNALILTFGNFIEYKYWISAVFVSIIFAGGIAFMWFLNISRPVIAEKSEETLLVTDQSVLKKFLWDRDSIRHTNDLPLKTKVPTGLFVEHLKVSGPNEINLSGFVWQKYDTGYSGKKGFFLPETSPDAEALNISKEFEKIGKSKSIDGWYFRTELRESIRFASYPFDRQVISLRIWPSGLDDSRMLVPDLGDYSVTNPAMLPGIEKNMILRGWKPVASYFDYEFRRYNTNFGSKRFSSDAVRPEMNFNVVIQRQFLGPFINNIIPLFVISTLLFTIVMSTSNRERDAKLGFTGFGVLEISAAFFFVVILAHIDLRNILGVQEVIYLDYFYFLIYLKILLYAVNSIIYTKYPNIKFFYYRNNLIPRLLYWPVYLGLLFIITCFIFY